MKIELDTAPPARNLVQSYSEAGIIINDVPYLDSIIVCPDHDITRWDPGHPSELTTAHLQPVIELLPELILLGTGKHLRFPAVEILISVQSLNIGIEVMDTAAACRAYNFIAGEGRRVVAALICINA